VHHDVEESHDAATVLTISLYGLASRNLSWEVKMNVARFALAFFLFFLVGTAHATQVVFSDFSDTSSLTLNGAAATVSTSDGVVLRVTPASGSQSGSAFSSATVNAADFSTFFKFRITEPGGSVFDCNTEAGADGLVFVVQSVRSDIGGSGAGIGYQGIDSSVGVEFDTWCNAGNNDPSSNHVGIVTDGSVNHGTGSPFTANISPDFDEGSIWYAWIDYNGTMLELRVSQTLSRPVAATLSRTVDIPAIIGQNDAYVGFTSGTGADWGNHDVIYWEYRDSYDPITEPDDSTGCCASIGSNNVVTLPCLTLGNFDLWVTLEFVTSPSGEVLVRVADVGLGNLCDGGTVTPPVDTCDDCACADYAAAHPDECGETGDLNFRLTWNDLNDVDLHVVYFNGHDVYEEIFYGHPVGTLGGELDVDANAGCYDNVTSRAVENVFYQDPEPGTYTLKVCGWAQCDSNSSSSVTAQVLVGGSVVQENQVTVAQWDQEDSYCMDVYTYTVH
jgi:hypothetical protein